MDVKIEELIADICVRLRVEREQLLGQCRKRNVVEARTVLVLVLDEVFKMSSVDIARLLGKEHAIVCDSRVRMEMLEEMGNGWEAVKLYRQLTKKEPLPDPEPVPELVPDPPKPKKRKEPQQKRCERCGRLLPLCRFPPSRHSHDGLQRICCDCVTAINMARRGRSCKKCVNYPCFWGMDTLDSDFASEGCVNYEARMLNG